MSFKDFIRQYEAKPPERLDGYSASDFADMSEEERVHARTMMLERALAGDTVDLAGLRYVGNEQTAASLKAYMQHVPSNRGPRFDIQCVETLFDLTADPQYLVQLISWTDGSDKAFRGFAAEALPRHVLPADLADPIISRLTDGSHEDMVRPLVEAWLTTRGEFIGTDMTAFQRCLPLIRTLCDSPPAVRMKLLTSGLAL